MEKENSRRDFIKKSALLTIAGAGMRLAGDKLFAADGDLYTLPPLPYPYQALEPYIDSLTMEIHHDKHHAGYVNNLNKAVKEAKLEQVKLDDLIKNVSKYPVSIRNNGGGHFNHSMFWKLLTPSGGGEPSGDAMHAINSSFGSFAVMQEKFNAAAGNRFGSGWAWLVMQNGKMVIGSTPNQDNPLMDVSDFKGTPVLCLDVWEHAYYLKYQNKRADYVAAFWNLVNWAEVNRLIKAG